MTAEKIAAFYGDPVKRACDAFSITKAYELRSFSTDPALRWAAARFAKFVLHWVKGAVRAMATAPRSGDLLLDGKADQGPVIEPIGVLRGRQTGTE
jgi:hypothetical protein